MRIKVNETCNVVTKEDANGFRSFGHQPKPQITVPSLKLRLSIDEAERLWQDINAAVFEAKVQLHLQEFTEKIESLNAAQKS